MSALAKFLAILLKELAPAILGWLTGIFAKKRQENAQEKTREGIDEKDTIKTEEGLGSDLAGKPSGEPGTGIRERDPKA